MSAISSSTTNNMPIEMRPPDRSQVTNGRLYAYGNRVAHNVKILAVGTVAILALASLPVADGGPVAFAACMAICLAATMGAFAPACAAACAAALAAPTP